MTDVIQEAQRLYKDATDATSDQRRQVEEDLRFSDPSDPQQWDDAVKRQRENDPGGSRPCLVMDHTGQYVDNVAGTVAKAPPSLHVVPVDSKADKKVAEQLDGLFRHIEYTSRAPMHYASVLRSAARTGAGYLIVRPEYVNRALNYQEPRIDSEPDPLKVVFDPWCLELDGKGAGFGFLLSSISERDFEARYGAKADKCSFSDVDRQRSEDSRESIIVAEEWISEERKMDMIVFVNPAGEEDTLPEQDYWDACKSYGANFPVLRTFFEKQRVVKWRQMSGSEVFEESEYPADQIGIIPVYGYVGYANGRMTFCGIPRRAMNPQRAYNYHQSELLAYMGNAPKAPWLAPVRAIKGLESLWDRASLDSRAYLPFNDMDDGGIIAAPSRSPIAVNLQNHMAGAEQSLRDLEATIGMYQANLGAPSNETSRVAIDGRKESGETSISHFPLNLSSSLGQVGRICVQMIPRLIDTKRQQRILGIDSTPGFVQIDPKQTQPVQETEKGLSINPSVGQYDVRVVIGTNFTTQRSQAQQALSEVMRTNPEMTTAIAPLWAMNLDVPNAEKLAQVFAAMAPPAVQAILNPEASKQPQTADLVQQNDELKKGLQEAIDHAHSAQQDADEAIEKLADKDEANRIAQYNAETNRLKVTGANMDQIEVIVGQLLSQMLQDAGPLPHDVPEPMPMEEQAPTEAPDEGGEMQPELIEGEMPAPEEIPPEVQPQPMMQE